jgi:hypothetical protein
MLVTEHEARENKACPNLMSVLDLKEDTCLGSNCMAWRWYDFPLDPKPPAGVLPPKGKFRPEDRRGFCGLAGIPEREGSPRS